MNGDFLSNTDNVVRLCGGSHLDPETGYPGPGAFMLRSDEAYLSVNWLEFFVQFGHENRLSEIQKVLARKRSIGKTARLALINVGNAIQIVGNSPLLTFTHEPIDSPGLIPDPSHSGINNLQGFEQLVAERLSQAVSEVSLAKIDE